MKNLTTINFFCHFIISILICSPVFSQNLTGKKGYWTEWISEEQGNVIANPGYYLAGYRCSGRYADNQQLYFVSYEGFNTLPGGTILSKWSNSISEEHTSNKYIAEQGYLITGINCSGEYCDNIKFRIGKNQAIDISVDRSEEFWTEWISEEKGRNEYLAPDGYFIIGYECKGSFCDNRRFLVAPLKKFKVPLYTSLNHAFLGNYPKDRQLSWSDECQGVTNDGKNWFFTQKGSLWKLPKHLDLNQNISEDTRGVKKVGIPEHLKSLGYDHFGDIEYYKGKIFVPLEGKMPSKIVVFDSQNLKFIGDADLNMAQGKAPWCAINPANGLLYSSHFDSYVLLAYRFKFTGGNFFLQRVQSEDIRIFNTNRQLFTVKSIQGAVFSKTISRLYVVSDKNGLRGIGIIDLQTETLIKTVEIDYDPDVDGAPWAFGEELEGITIWDLDMDDEAPEIDGNVHVIMIDNVGRFEDDLYFKHFSFDSEAGREWTNWISEEHAPTISKPGYYLAGYRCSGKYADKRQLYFRHLWNSNTFENAHIDGYWSSSISEEKSKYKFEVENGYLIAGLQCIGDYCDNIKLYSTRNKGLQIIVDEHNQYWSKWISEETGRNQFIAPEGHFIIGYECRGNYCDQRRFLYAPVITIKAKE